MGDIKVTINGIDFLGLIDVIDSINRRWIKITLNNVEQVFYNDSLSNDERFKLIRKYILDGFNEQSRTMLRSLFDNEDRRDSEKTK